MAGIYIHIPFCRKACHFCNFHFSTSLHYHDRMIDAIHQELELRKNFFIEQNVSIESIYFGGGTPSILEAKIVESFINHLSKYYPFADNVEVTLEANPDDLSQSYLAELKTAGINRLSVGIQSLYDESLQWMNRSHSAVQARNCIEYIHAVGYENFTIDWIYGYPLLSLSQLEQQLTFTESMGIPHFSAYALTVEPNTALDIRLKKGLEDNWSDAYVERDFYFLMEWAHQNDYDHYEISNFSKNGFRARHNSNYWNDIPYLGLGPSAHSFDGQNRFWNLAHNAEYMKLLQTKQKVWTAEDRSRKDCYNEYIMTNFRKKEGINIDLIDKHFPEFKSAFNNSCASYTPKSHLEKTGNFVFLSRKGKLFCDRVSSHFFVV